MLDPGLLKKIHRIEIQSKKSVNQLFAGEYRSVFKGQGLEFHEVREYQPGDDIRGIDWNVTARLGAPFVKKYVEERQRTILLAVDVSGSQDYGSLARSKNDIAAELAAVLAFSAVENNDLVGLLLFSDQVEKYIPPKKGRKHVLRIIRDILKFKRQGRKTDIAQALRYLSRVHRKSSILFLLSDFIDQNFEKPLLGLARRHDLIPVLIKDCYEKDLPHLPALVTTEDPESGKTLAVDFSDPRVREQYRRAAEESLNRIKKFFRSIKAEIIEISTDGSYVKTLNLFFKRRQKRLKMGI
jgi:uncharacterized protein (DUF58 family)